MTARWTRSTLFLLLLVLAGCYRQAAEPLEPINNPTATPAVIMPADTPTTQPDIQGVIPETETLPPITVIQPTVNPLSTEPPLELPTEDFSATGAETAVIPITPLIASPTLSIITPNSPSGLIVIDTATPSPNPLNTATPSGLITPTSVFEPEGECGYTVQTGDNLFRIAVNHDVSLDELRLANPDVVGDLIQPGQVLTIPGCTPGGSAINPAQPTPEPQLTTVGGGRTHVVQAGETLLAIARQYGVTVQDLVDANSLTNPNQLSVGQELKIP